MVSDFHSSQVAGIIGNAIPTDLENYWLLQSSSSSIDQDH
jgi:hypothetical protein